MKLVDASSWIEFLRGRSSEAGLRVKDLLARGEASWCELTLVELWNGARGKIEKGVLADLEAELRLVPVNERVWAKARDLARCCRDKGITVPTTDIVITACAALNDLELEHCDEHFTQILPLAVVK